MKFYNMDGSYNHGDPMPKDWQPTSDKWLSGPEAVLTDAAMQGRSAHHGITPVTPSGYMANVTVLDTLSTALSVAARARE